MPIWTLRPSKTPPRGRFCFASLLASGMGGVALTISWLAANHYPPWTSFHGEAAAFAALVLVCAGQLLSGQVGHWRGPAVVALVAAGILAAQWAAGQIAYGGDAVLSGLYLLGACWAFWAGKAARQSPCASRDPAVWLATAFCVGASISVLVGLLQWLRMETALGIFAVDRGPDSRIFGNLGQPNHLATLCGMAAFLAVYLFQARRLKSWHLSLLHAWLALGVTFSESRSGLLGAVLAGGGMLLAAPDARTRRQLLRPTLVWWLLLATAALAWAPLNGALLLQAARGAQFTHDSARATMWAQSISAISAAPWAGYGWRQTMYAQKLAAAHVPGSLATDYAHNIVLDLMIWIGVPAALALIAIGCTWSIRFLRRIRTSSEAILLASLIPFLVHSLFEFPFAYAYFLLPVAWILGQLASRQQLQAQSEQAARQLWHAWAALLLVGYAGIAMTLGSEYLQVEEDYRVMRFELRRVGRIPDGYVKPEIRLLTQMSALLKVGRIVPRPDMPQAELDMMQTASERNGWATLDLAYATALGLNGQPREAGRRLALIGAVYGPQSGQQAQTFFGEFRARYPILDRVAVH